MPLDWSAVLGLLAASFNFPPSELWAMSGEDLVFWFEAGKASGVIRQRG